MNIDISSANSNCHFQIFQFQSPLFEDFSSAVCYVCHFPVMAVGSIVFEGGGVLAKEEGGMEGCNYCTNGCFNFQCLLVMSQVKMKHK